MTANVRRAGAATVFGLATLFAAGGFAQPPGKGPPPGKGKGMGMGKDEKLAADRDVFHFLLDHYKDITRAVKETKTGVETVTESDKPEVAKKIQEHAAAMHERVKSGKGVRHWDPLFVEIFKNYDKVVMKVEKTAKGVKVTETSDDPYVAKLIKAHAAVVTKFVADGYDEAHEEHPAPAKPEPKKP